MLIHVLFSQRDTPPERPPAYNPEYGPTHEFTNVAAIQPNPFGVSGATGLGMTPEFTNAAAIQPNPFSVSGATGPGVNSLPPTDLPSYEALVPTPRSPPATDTLSTSTRAPPPTYYELCSGNNSIDNPK